MDNIAIIFSAFDDKIGQVVLFNYGIENELANSTANHVAISILSALSGAPDSATFSGESIIPLVDEKLVAFAYYFYLSADQLREPSFSFVLYCLPLDHRDKLYANIQHLIQVFDSVMKRIKNEIKLVQPLSEKTVIPDSLVTTFKELAVPIGTLLGEHFRESSSGLIKNASFIESMACSVFENPTAGINVIFQDNMNEIDVQRITIRLMAGILSRLTHTRGQGEAILPVIDDDKIAFAYFFPFESTKTGIFQVFTGTNNRTTMYRWAPVLSAQFSKIAKDFQQKKISKNLPREIRRQLTDLYYLDTAALDYLYQRSQRSEKSVLVGQLETLLRMKNIDKLFHTLILGTPVIITGIQYPEAQEMAKLLDSIITHRNMTLKESQAFLPEKIEKNALLFIPVDKIPQKPPKNITIIQADKRAVSATNGSTYAKNLVKQFRKKTLDEITSIMKTEMEFILDEVSRLVEITRIEDSEEAKNRVDTQMMNLPHKDMIDIIKELAISYNPILAELIEETLIYSMKTALWDM